MYSQLKDDSRLLFVCAAALVALLTIAGAESKCQADDAVSAGHCQSCVGGQRCSCECPQCRACCRAADAWWCFSDPQAVARYAIPSNTRFYTGGYVGGGTILPGDARYSNEGTWGWDYSGLLPKHTWLNWSHGRRYQGGSGAYKSDGPKLKLHH